MNKELLFQKTEAEFHGIKPFGMSYYDFYSKSDRKHADQYRNHWNTLFQDCMLPQNNKLDIRKRFISKSDGNHNGALFELFVYHFFKSTGLKVEEALPLKTSKPDFKVTTTNRDEFYIEATCTLGDQLPSREDKFYGRIYDAINKIESSNFRI